MATGKIPNLSHETLVFRGTFTGDIDDANNPYGIYYVAAATSYTHKNFDDGGITVPSYCAFIQFPYVTTQLFLTSPLIIRKLTGNPNRWRTYQFDHDKGYIEP